MLNNSIKDKRQGRGLTQEELAAAAGVSRQTIVAIEKGDYIPSLDLAMRLAAFFKLPVERLFYFK